MDLQSIIYTHLLADSNVTGLLADYSGSYALFSSFAPEGVTLGERPMLIIDAANSDENDDTFSEEYRRAETFIRIYAKSGGSEASLVSTAEAVRNSLKSWSPGAVTGGEMVNASVSGPVTAPVASPDERGRLITLTTLIKDQ